MWRRCWDRQTWWRQPETTRNPSVIRVTSGSQYIILSNSEKYRCMLWLLWRQGRGQLTNMSFKHFLQVARQWGIVIRWGAANQGWRYTSHWQRMCSLHTSTSYHKGLQRWKVITLITTSLLYIFWVINFPRLKVQFFVFNRCYWKYNLNKVNRKLCKCLSNFLNKMGLATSEGAGASITGIKSAHWPLMIATCSSCSSICLHQPS